MVTAANTKTIPDPKLFVSHFNFIHFNKHLSILRLILIMLNFFVEKNRSLCCRNSICRIHSIYLSKTFTLLLKSKILDFETLNHVHVYRIQYISYRQAPYRIRIDTANDRIVPTLQLIKLSYMPNMTVLSPILRAIWIQLINNIIL